MHDTWLAISGSNLYVTALSGVGPARPLASERPDPVAAQGRRPGRIAADRAQGDHLLRHRLGQPLRSSCQGWKHAVESTCGQPHLGLARLCRRTRDRRLLRREGLRLQGEVGAAVVVDLQPRRPLSSSEASRKESSSPRPRSPTAACTSDRSTIASTRSSPRRARSPGPTRPERQSTGRPPSRERPSTSGRSKMQAVRPDGTHRNGSLVVPDG